MEESMESYSSVSLFDGIGGDVVSTYSEIMKFFSLFKNLDNNKDTEENRKLVMFKFQTLLCLLAQKYFFDLCCGQNNYFTRGYFYQYFKEIYKKYMSDCFSEFDLALDIRINSCFDPEYHIYERDSCQSFEAGTRSYIYQFCLKIKPAIENSVCRYYFLDVDLSEQKISKYERKIKNCGNFFNIKEIDEEEFNRYKQFDEEDEKTMVVL